VDSTSNTRAASSRIPEIDGLRAIALLLVLFYHCKFSFLPVSGGFLGVDLFFVISGFVIARGVWQKMEDKTFKVSDFFSARIVRLYPGLFLTLVITSILAWIIMLPRELESYRQSLFSTAGLFSNFYFWQQSNYFSPSVDYLPLIHTWSLGVEEQFYLIFPFAFLLLFLAKRNANRILWVLLAGSLSIFIILANNYPVITFYLLPFRIWEILIGVLLSRYIYKENFNDILHSSKLEFLGSLALVLILALTFGYQHIAINTVYLQVIVVAFFAILLISIPRTKYLKILLRTKSIQKIGALSYVAYLVHQPILVFMRLVNRGAISNWQKMLAFLLTFLTAEIIWHSFERPIRNWIKSSDSKRRVPSLFAGGSLVILILGLTITHSGMSLNNYSAAEKQILSFNDSDYVINYDYGKCFLLGTFTIENSYHKCFKTSEPGTGTFLFGDSHAAMVAIPLRDSQERFSFLTRSGCFALLPNRLMASDCNTYFSYDLKKIAEQKPERILLGGNWYEGSLGTTYGASILSQSLDATIRKIHVISPNSKIFVIGQTPLWPPNLPSIMVREKVSLQPNQMVAVDNLSSLKEMDSRLSQVVVNNGAMYINILDKLCKSNKCLAVTSIDGVSQPLVFDSNHLTQAGEIKIAGIIRNEIF